MRIYIAGPMTGYKSHNLPLFDLLARKINGMGHEAVNPADIGRHYGIHEHTILTGEQRRMLLLADLKALETCDAIFLLPGWQNSKGAVCEFAFARYCSLRVFDHLSQLKGKAA